METKAKKKSFNLIMVAVIAVILVVGILVTGHIKGWFGGSAGEVLVCQKTSGIVNVERSGVGYTLKQDTVMQEGDLVETRNGSGVSFQMNEENTISLGEKTQITLPACSVDDLRIDIENGDFFAEMTDAPAHMSVDFGSHSAKITGTVFSISQQKVSSLLCVYEGSVEVTAEDGSEHTIEAGKQLLLARYDKDDELVIEESDLKATSLSDDVVNKLLACKTKKICFDEAQLKNVLADREKEKQEAAKALEAAAIRIAAGDEDPSGSNASAGSSNTDENNAAGTGDSAAGSEAGSSYTDAGSGSNGPGAETGVSTSSGSNGSISGSGDSRNSVSGGTNGGNNGTDSAESGSQGAGSSQSAGNQSSGSNAGSGTSSGSNGTGSENGAAGDDVSPADRAENNDSGESTGGGSSSSDVKTCTISIRCTAILDQMDRLAEGKDRYVPANGIILETSPVEFLEGETAYDVTKRACNALGIQMEAAYTPVYGSYYVEGINHLYEFDCGEMSGWLYHVNGWTPNYGCSEYTLEDGDSIVWDYTCTGQ